MLPKKPQPVLHKITLVCYDKDDWDNDDVEDIAEQIGLGGYDDWIGKGRDIRCVLTTPSETIEGDVDDIFGDNL